MSTPTDQLPGRIGLIDLGSNSAQMSVLFADPTQGKRYEIAEELLLVTGLSRNRLPDGRLNPTRSRRGLDALRHFASRLRAMGIQGHATRAAATAGLRQSRNADDFLDQVHRELGLPLTLISGEEEAELVALAQERSFPGRGPLLVVDIGGGSTEVALRRPGDTEWSLSLPIGSVKLGEAHGSDLKLILSSVQGAVSKLPRVHEDCALVGVAGTVTTALQVLRGTALWDPTQLHGRTLGRSELGALVERLAKMTPEQRRAQAGLHPGRSEFIVGGVALLVGLMDQLGRDEVIVSDRGVRFGLFWRSWPEARLREHPPQSGAG